MADLKRVRQGTAMQLHSCDPVIQEITHTRAGCLQLLHGSNVRGLDVVLEVLADPLLEVVQGDLVILDDEGDLELGDTVSDGDKLGGTPNETVDLHGSETGLEGLHVSLIIPRLDLEGDDGLGSWSGTLCGLLLLVLCDSLGLDPG